MKYILDAHFPKSLARLIEHLGFDCVHTLDLPLRNKSTDEEIRLVAQREHRVVISKDDDFLRSHFERNLPPKLLRVRTGNMPKAKLLELFELRMPELDEHFSNFDFIELYAQFFTLHPPSR